MNLDSNQNIILLKNCVILQINALKHIRKTHINASEIEQAIQYYQKLKEFLLQNNIENAINLLKTPTDSDDFSKFSEHIISTSPEDISEEYFNLISELAKEANSNPEPLVTAFYTGIEDLNPEKYKDEPEENLNSEYLTDEMKNYLNTLKNLVNHKFLAPEQFQIFATKFRDTTKSLALAKYQQVFDKLGKSIKQMDILYNKNQNGFPIYETDFTLINNNDNSEESLILAESAPNSGFVSTYYQNICYSYLEADKYSKEQINPDEIFNKLSFFRNCYLNLNDMSKCEFKIANGKVIPLDYKNYEPSGDELSL